MQAKRKKIQWKERKKKMEISGKSNNNQLKFEDNVDSWIKILKARITDLEYLKNITNENTDNIQHNYELIYELKDEIKYIKNDLNALKLIQIIRRNKK